MEGNPKAEQDQMKRLFKYLVAVSCRKTDQRIKSTHSRTYWNALCDVDLNSFTFNSEESNQPPPGLNLDSERQATIKAGITSDYDFLVLLTELNHPSRLDPDGASKYFSTQTPNMLQKAQHMISTGQRYSFYDETTWREFHEFLLDLLKRFKVNMSTLSELRGLDFRSPGGADATNFQNTVNTGRVLGYMLTRLARGRAFQQHIANIGPLLAEFLTQFATPPTVAETHSTPEPTSIPVFDDDTEMEDDESPPIFDEETKGMKVIDEINEDIEPAERIPLEEKGSLVKAFLSWFRLMVGPLDGAEIITEFVNDPRFPFTGISITMVTPPKTTTEVLPWRRLFNDGNLFPQSDPLKPLNGVTNSAIEAFMSQEIEKAEFSTGFYKLSRQAQRLWYEMKELNRVIPVLEKIKKLKFPKDKDSNIVNINSIITSITKFQKAALDKIKETKKAKWVSPVSLLPSVMDLEAEDPETLVEPALLEPVPEPTWKSIATSIDCLCIDHPVPPPSSSFFINFAKEDSFGGAMHCEVFMATLIDNAAHPGTYHPEWNLQEKTMKVSTPFLYFCCSLYQYCIMCTGLWKRHWGLKVLLPRLFLLPSLSSSTT